MGWETGVSLGFNALSGYNKIQQGKAQSEAIAQQGEQEAQNYADATTRRLGSLETSFTHGGIALDNLGGTSAIFQQAANQGITNINRTINNANAASSNAFNAARTASLESIASGFKSMGAGGSLDKGLSSAGNYLTDQTAYAFNDAGYGNTAYDMLDPSP